MAKHTVRNTTAGFRGLNAVDGYVELAPGETREGVDIEAAELASAKRTGYFAFDGAADEAEEADEGGKALDKMSKAELEATATAEGVDISAATNNAGRVAAIEAARAAKAGGAPTPTPAPDDLDKMSDDDLRTTVAAVTGKPVGDYATTEREELLKLARGE